MGTFVITAIAYAHSSSRSSDFESAGIEIEEVEDEPTLAVLKEAAQDTDKALFDATARKVQMIASRNFAKEVRGAGNVDVQDKSNGYGEMILNYAVVFFQPSPSRITHFTWTSCEPLLTCRQAFPLYNSTSLE
ncbi:hypothetical protein LZ31DRAFT_544601 [Colletotrichum somersetense]|nr:hypothetical protein LZ31DRAFT_544601 [Colletotrichum somersetense]